jgi:hypothetical protein
MEEDKPTLLFVNKTQDSDDLSKSEGEEKNRILSHVQTNRWGKQRKRKLKTSGPAPWKSYTSLIRLSEDEPPAERLSAAGPSGKKNGTPETRHTIPNREHKHDRDLTLVQDQIQTFYTRLAEVYPPQNASDPFHVTAGGVQINAAHHAMLHVTFRHIARANFLSEAFAPRSVIARRQEMRHNRGMTERLRNCVEHELLLYSTLAYASSLLSWMAGVTLDSRPPEYFAAKALPALRSQLSRYGSNRHPDTWFMFSLYSLSASSMWDMVPRLWASNCPPRYMNLRFAKATKPEAACQGARAHLNAIRHFVNDSGGWNTLDPYLMESIVMAGKYLTLSDMQPPVVHYSAFDPGEMNREMSKRLDIPEGTFPGLGRNFQGTTICSDLREIIKQGVDFIRVSTHAWSMSNTSTDIETWLFLRLHALIYRLLSQDIEGLSPLDNSVRLGILTLLLSCIENPGSKLCTADMVAPHLRRALESFNPPVEDEQHNRVRLWCLCMGAMSIFPSSADRGWYVCSTAALALSVLPDRSESAFEAELHSFLLLPSRQGARLSALVDELRSGYNLALRDI